MSTSSKTPESRPKKNRPKIPIPTQLKLWVKAGGRCEFKGCPRYVHRDDLTLLETNYAHIAHIVGYSRDGPRGDDPLPIADRQNFENLMLLCLDHHKLVDSKEHEHRFPKELLQSWKAEHEERIFRHTGFDPRAKTTVVRLRAAIADDPVAVAIEDVRDAIFPLFPAEDELDIELRDLGDRGESSYWTTASSEIEHRVKTLLARCKGNDAIKHFSVFGLAPIPLLVYLGRCLGRSITADLYQHHGDTGDWTWKAEGSSVDLQICRPAEQLAAREVGIVLSLSGTISREHIPERVRCEWPLYEVTPNVTPNRTFLRRRQDLEQFRIVYQELLGVIKTDNPDAELIHLFPAIPSPVAITCGRDLMPKAHPAVLVYEFRKKNGVFVPALRVNDS